MITHPNVKINLGLNVLRKREDRFHDLETLFVPYFGISDTLEIVAGDMKVEKIVLAEEIKEQNPDVLSQVEAFFDGQAVEVEFVSHTELKARTHDCKAVIRTGETTPYANIILQSGCIFA